jgi:hypothetical protein
MSVQQGSANGSPNFNGNKNILVAEVMPGDPLIVRILLSFF